MKTALNLFRGLTAAALTALTGCIVYLSATLPDSFVVAAGSPLILSEYLQVSSERILPENYSPANNNAFMAAAVSPEAIEVGTSRTEQLRLLGIFPIKNVTVTEVEEPAVIPCGTPFGIKMLTEGVMVVELTGFDSGNGISSPAKDAGIDKGDIIVSISGRNVSTNADVSRIIEGSGGKALGVELIRNDEHRVVFLRPAISTADGCYHAGMWVRDSSAGIGTVTFYDPLTGIFAGLGHPVCDQDTGEILTMSKGEAAEVTISGVRKSAGGDPGELMGMFTSDNASGELLLNSEAGIYGTMYSCPVTAAPVGVAMRQEIEEGEAQILTTIAGNDPEKYTVEIERIDLSDSSGSHNMVIHVTDERLLNEAGGIVQGMSGSPIIQNGRLVGAVTHVLVRDPTRGYAIFADSMIQAASEADRMT